MSGGSAGAYTVLYTTSAYARGLEPLMRTGFFFPSFLQLTQLWEVGNAALIGTVRVIVGSGCKLFTRQVEAAVKLARMGEVDRKTRSRQHVTITITMTIGCKSLFLKSSLRF